MFLVMAHRYGTNEYIFPVGIFEIEENAIAAAKDHREYRGGKYDHKMYTIEYLIEYDAEGCPWKWITGNHE